MDNAFDDLQEVPVCDNIAEADELIANHELWKSDPLQQASQQYEELNSLVQEMADLGSTDNPYTTLTAEVRSGHCLLLNIFFFYRVFMRNGVNSLMLFLNEILFWKKNCKSKIVRTTPTDHTPNIFLLTDNENLRQDFAAKANQAGAYIDAKNAALSDLSLQSQGTLEEQLQVLKSFHEEVIGFQPTIDSCEAANRLNQEALVFDNPHTKYTIEVQILCKILFVYYNHFRLFVLPGANST